MKIMTFNANGIRSAATRGYFRWLTRQDVDVVCVQETRAQLDQLVDEHFRPAGYHCFYNDAKKPGYAGTAIYTRHTPKRVQHGLGWEPVDSEGRWLQVDFAGLSIVSLYMPSGSAGPERQARKFEVMDKLMPHLRSLRRKRREFVLCADWNICHKQIDLKNWRSNQKNSGFLPEERVWLDVLYGEVGYVDAFRVVNQQEDQYTWWSNRGRARENNVGWRLDYMVVTPGLKTRVRGESVFRDARFSDHAPLTMEFDWPL